MNNNFITESGSEQDKIQVMAVTYEKHCVLFSNPDFFGSSLLTSLVDKSWPIKHIFVFHSLKIRFVYKSQ